MPRELVVPGLLPEMQLRIELDELAARHKELRGLHTDTLNLQRQERETAESEKNEMFARIMSLEYVTQELKEKCQRLELKYEKTEEEIQSERRGMADMEVREPFS